MAFGGILAVGNWLGRREESMRTPLRKIRDCRAIAFVLAVAWLPYIATRCIENPLTHHCSVLPAAAHAHAGETHEPSHHGMASAHDDQHHKTAPAHTCCDLTGKCNMKLAAATPSFVPIHLVAILPLAVDASVPYAELPPQRDAAALAHAPPTYLRNATLLI
jgi:hypothetical protein